MKVSKRVNRCSWAMATIYKALFRDSLFRREKKNKICRNLFWSFRNESWRIIWIIIKIKSQTNIESRLFIVSFSRCLRRRSISKCSSNSSKSKNFSNSNSCYRRKNNSRKQISQWADQNLKDSIRNSILMFLLKTKWIKKINENFWNCKKN